MPGEADVIEEIGADPESWQPLTSDQWDEAVAAYTDSFDQAAVDRVTTLCQDTATPEDVPDDGHDDGGPLSVGDPSAHRTRLLLRMCDTCIFRPGDAMHVNPGRLRDLVDQAGADGFVICYSTLPGMAPAGVRPAVCRGFADRYDTQALQVISRLFGFDEIDPPTIHHGG